MKAVEKRKEKLTPCEELICIKFEIIHIFWLKDFEAVGKQRDQTVEWVRTIRTRVSLEITLLIWVKIAKERLKVATGFRTESMERNEQSRNRLQSV